MMVVYNKEFTSKTNKSYKRKRYVNYDEIVFDESQIASGLNEYFSTEGRELDQPLPAHTNPIPVRQQSRTVSSFFIFPESHEECLKTSEVSKTPKVALNLFQLDFS